MTDTTTTKKIVINAFSAMMLDLSKVNDVRFTPASDADAKAFVADGNFVSAVGHADTAAVFSTMLGTDVAFNRISAHLNSGDTALLGQVTGGRLPEGCTTLPDGVKIKWLIVTVQ